MNTAAAAPPRNPAADAADAAAALYAERHVRRILRGQYVGFERADLLQQARLELWQARCDGRVPADPEHALRYAARRAQGAMLDHARAARRQVPAGAAELTPDIEPHAPVPAPDARLRVRDALRLLARRGSARMAECIELLARGHAPREVAAALGVTETAVSQWRKRARVIAGGCL